MHAVAECARKVAMTGATPVAATNCLNFGNPEKPEIIAQLSAAIDGIAEACNALGTPITGGDVSLYNETRGEGIYPTPVLGIVGILEDVTKPYRRIFSGKAMRFYSCGRFPEAENQIRTLKSRLSRRQSVPILCTRSLWIRPSGRTTYFCSSSGCSGRHHGLRRQRIAAFGSSEFAEVVLGSVLGNPPTLDLEAEADLHTLLVALAARKLLRSARDISDGGIAVALAQLGFSRGIGATVEQDPSP